MQIERIKITNFRSLHNFECDLQRAAIICGTNSCGKSNVLRAIRFAFLVEYHQDRLAENFSYLVASPNASITVKLTFDSPTPEIARALNLPVDRVFTYQVSVKRNASVAARINGVQIDSATRAAFLDLVGIVHVPPIRDLAAGGLDFFRATLAAAIRRARGDDSLSRLNVRVKSAFQAGGRSLLSSTQASARNLLSVDQLSVDVRNVDLDMMLPKTGMTYKVGGKELGLERLGTGHQSSVILSLYRQLGAATGKFMLYLFEEPDNHLHPSSVRAVAEDLKKCLTDKSQTLITTHSPYFLNQFPVDRWVPLSMDEDRSTILRKRHPAMQPQELVKSLAAYGLKPAEAMLASRVIVVEGANDAALISELFELSTGTTLDQRDVLLVPVGGKSGVAELCILLNELGANWFALLDWDAVEDNRAPMMDMNAIGGRGAEVIAALDVVYGGLRSPVGGTSKQQKWVDSMRAELATDRAVHVADRAASVLGKLLVTLRIFTAADLASFWALVDAGRHSAIRSRLVGTRIWLWNKAPEQALLGSAGADVIVEDELRAAGRLAAVLAPNNRLRTLENKLHELGHAPLVLRSIVRRLYAGQMLRGGEWTGIIRRLKE